MCDSDVMDEVALRDLRNNTSDVLRRVEGGEQLTVTVNGRGVARLVPLPRRPQFLPWQQLLADQADPGLGEELRELLPDTTDDIEDPWSRGVH
jgi:prevent-host-death family protein